MNTANYKNNGLSKYPLSTDALDFIQQQICLVYNLTDLHGKDYILRQSSLSTDGLVVYDGELMPLKGNVADYITIRQQQVSVTAVGETYNNIRTIRFAEYTAYSSDNSKAKEQFLQLKTIPQLEGIISGLNDSLQELENELTEAKRHTMPRGAIIMWSGAIGNIPPGFALCDGQNGTPNLSGRFIVGVGPGTDQNSVQKLFALGERGGEYEHRLTADESGLPAHRHKFIGNSNQPFINNAGEICLKHISTTGSGSESVFGKNTSSDSNAGTLKVGNVNALSASVAHNNLPPYYALAYIMKII